MKIISERILTTHTGGIGRPDELIAIMREKENDRPYDETAFAELVRESVAEFVQQRCAAGLDVMNEGERGKSGFTTYQEERLGSATTADSPHTPSRERSTRTSVGRSSRHRLTVRG